MFRFLLNYSPAVFRKGEFVLLGSWPVWVLAVLVILAGAALGWAIRRRRRELAPGIAGRRPVAIWALQAALAALLLLLLWQPALRVSTLKPQQNVVAVIIDDSESMAREAGGVTRTRQATDVLNGGLLEKLAGNFQVRLYRMGAHLERIQSLEQLSGDNPATRIGESLQQVVTESASLPVGAVVLLSDGADNSGGVDRQTISQIRSRRIPVHTVGFGREKPARDIEISDVETPARALADSRLVARVTFRQYGYRGRKARLTVMQGGKVLAAREIEFEQDGVPQTEPVLFNAGAAGAKQVLVSIGVLDGEENVRNNMLPRLINVEASKPKVLYLEGEPRWEYKFIRRALAGDRTVHLVSLLRTTQNKMYRQGINDPAELKEGFPARVEELFRYQGLILGSVEASYFTAGQQELIRQFVDRRGGGVLFLAGRAALGDGGYAASAFAGLLPVSLPSRKGTFHRDRAPVALTEAGRESLITRLVEDADRNVERWGKLPELADYQEIGAPKPGATVLAELATPAGRRLPLLVTQNYGYGRVAVFATGGSWRWQMRQKLEDQTHEIFWRQLLRWLVTGAPGRVTVTTPRQVLLDEDRVELAAVVREPSYAPMADARVEARILGPGGSAASVELRPDPQQPGTYRASWQAAEPGSFLAEVIARRGEEEVGRDVLAFRRDDGVAENFHVEQNRELLEKLSEETGGRYYTPETAGKLAEEISYSEAGITVREFKELWNMPAVFLLLILLKTAEWYLRRRWGVV